MKRLLLIASIIITTLGYSQSNKEMKYVNRNKIEYGGEIIKLQRAIELSEGVSVDAKIHFQVARISPAMKCLTFVTVPLLTKFGIDLIERESYIGGVVCLYLAGSHITNFIRPDGWKKTLIKEGIKEYNKALSN